MRGGAREKILGPYVFDAFNIQIYVYYCLYISISSREEVGMGDGF